VRECGVKLATTNGRLDHPRTNSEITRPILKAPHTARKQIELIVARDMEEIRSWGVAGLD
jgi:hypothetical protein